MSERLEKIADEILAVVNKKRVSGETPEKDVWVATYLPNREQIAVIFGDREVSGSYVQKRFNKDDKQSIISTLEQLYGAEPRNHNEEGLDEDTVYDHSWYEVKGQKYPKRTKEGVIIKESYDESIQDTDWNSFVQKIGKRYLIGNTLCWQHLKTYIKVTKNGNVYIMQHNDILRRAFSDCKTFDDIYDKLYTKNLLPSVKESVIKEGVEKINPKVLDELYDIISDQMGDMYMANYDEIDFDNLLDSVEDFGNDIDGYNPALKKDYALALKAKWEENHPSEIEETCSGGATCAGAVCEAPGNIGSVKKSVSKVTKTACPTKRKHKKVSDEIDSILVKESILNDMPCESEINGHKFKYFMNEGKWYFSVDNCLVKTHDKDVMMETFDQIVDDEKVTASLLEDYSCYEMELLMEDGANVTAYPGDGSELSKSPGSEEEMNPEEIATFAMAKKAEDAIKNGENKDANTIETSQEKAEKEAKKQKILNNNNQKVLYKDEKGNLASGVQQLAKEIDVKNTAGETKKDVMATIKTSDGKEIIKSVDELETPEKETL